MQNQFTAVRHSHVIRTQSVRINVMRSGVCAAVSWFAFALFPVPSVEAAALSNKDNTTYKVDVLSKHDGGKHQLAPGKSITGFCKAGCIIRLNEDDANDYELEGTERVSIEGGLVYYDGEEIIKPADTPAPTK